MVNNEKKFKQSTQVAYLKCLEDGQKNLILEGKEGPFTIRNLILASNLVDTEAIKQYMEADGLDFNTEKIQKIIEYSDLSEDDKQIITQLEDEIFGWKIVDIHDMTMQNGFYACVMETSNDEAIIGIRGSEGFEDYAGAIHDWVEADFGLLNNEETKQMTETSKYAQKLVENNILDKYKKIDVAGHSLGGNLSSHFVIDCASSIEKEELFNKIDRVYNFDGQGVSDEYINIHKTAINKAASKINHYKWSPIGDLLYDIPGENEYYLKTRKYYGGKGLIDKIKYYTFWKHDTRSITFDENGMAERGKQGILAKEFKLLSLGAEQLPTLTNAMASLAYATIGKMIYQKEDGQIGFKLPFVKRAKDDYRNQNENYENMKIKCGDMINGFVEKTKTFIMDKCNERNISQFKNTFAERDEGLAY